MESIWYKGGLKARIARRINLAVHSLYVDINPDYRASILLSGSNRSGSTWVGDILNYDNEYRLIAEPFNNGQVEMCRHFPLRPYLRSENDDPKFLEPATTIFTGRARGPWIDSVNRRVVCTKRLIKDVRSTLMLKWVHRHFPGMPIILLMRHPCAVAHSRVVLRWDNDLRSMFLSQNELMEDFLNPFRDAMEKAKSEFETCILNWCVENYVPLQEFARGQIFVMFYERLCTSPEAEIKRLFEFVGKPYNPVVLDRLWRPSLTARKRPQKGEVSAIVSGESLIDGWRKSTTSEQVRRAVEIVGMFGLDRIYSDDSMPKVESADSVLQTNRPSPAASPIGSKRA